MLRSAYPAMNQTAKLILKNGRSLEAADKNCMSIKEILEIIKNGNKLTSNKELYQHICMNKDELYKYISHYTRKYIYMYKYVKRKFLY